jgi:hypothetical protein
MGMNRENTNRTLIRLYQYAEEKVFDALERNEYMLAYIYSQALVEICEKLYPFYGRGKDEKEPVSDYRMENQKRMRYNMNECECEVFLYSSFAKDLYERGPLIFSLKRSPHIYS